MRIWQTLDGGHLTSIAADSPGECYINNYKIIYFNDVDVQELKKTLSSVVILSETGNYNHRHVIISERVSPSDMTAFDWYDGPRQEVVQDGCFFWDIEHDVILVKFTGSYVTGWFGHEIFAKELIAQGRFPKIGIIRRLLEG